MFKSSLVRAASAAIVALMAGEASAAPSIFFINPANGPTSGSILLTIAGSNFSSTGNSVTIDGNTCLPLSEGTTQILCRVPAGTGATNEVIVADDTGASSNSVNFLYDGPTMTEINPLFGEEAGGTVITISGNNFGRPEDDALRHVSVGAAGTCALVPGGGDHTEVRCTMPPGTGSNVDVSITVDGQTSSALQFDYIPPPSLTSISASSGSTQGGGTLTINGTSFRSSGNVVEVGSLSCPVTSESSVQIKCTIPEGLGADQEVLVTADGGTGGGQYFDYDPPSIVGIDPSHGPTEGNVPITIQGSNFGPAWADAMRSVTVGTSSCPLVASSSDHHQVVCTLPPGQGAGRTVQVLAGGQPSNTITIDYDPPSIDSIAPARASAGGGTVITIHGLNFGQSASVFVDGHDCPLALQSPAELRCTGPAATPGAAVPVVVSVSGQVDSSPIEYVAPACGNGIKDIQTGEVCDDNNGTSGDGCSSDCRSEHNEAKDQVSCILAMNKAAAGIFKAQAKEDLACAKKGDGTACIAIPSDGVTKATDKAAATSSKKCTTAPDFGSAPLSDVQNANVDEEVAFVHDLFGPDPDAALADSALAPNRGACQDAVLAAEQKYMLARLKAFGKCKKAGFKEGTILTDSQLAACLATADSDPAMAKPTAAQFSALLDSCVNVSEDTALAFPGSCSVSPAVGACIESLARCHTCRALKMTDSLVLDCDDDDDGIDNDSCN